VTRTIVIMFLVLLLVAAGLGLYAYHLKNHVALEEQRLAKQQSIVLPPATGPTTSVTFYVASDDDGTLHRSQEAMALPEERSERVRTILRALFALYPQTSPPSSTSAVSDFRDVFLLGNDTAIVDTSAAFANSQPSGVLAEELTIASIVATLHANNPQIVRVKILVDGNERETLAGHADLRRFYTAGEFDTFVKDAK
jgi:Sporulation and spore germination